MGKYNSDSESSVTSKKKKTSRTQHRSSSRSSSGSRYSSRSHKGKKYKKSRRSRSRERPSKNSRDVSRDRYSRRSKTPSSRRKRRNSRSRSRTYNSRSRSTSKSRGHRSRRSRSKRKSEERSKDHKQRSRSKSSSQDRTKNRSRSRTPNKYPRKIFEDDGVDLLMKLNKAVVEAMAEKSKGNVENESSLEYLINREKAIKDINAPNFVAKSFTSGMNTLPGPICTAPPKPVPPELQNSLLHPNLLMENQVDKLNRWVKKLFLIRQRCINGEPLDLA